MAKVQIEIRVVLDAHAPKESLGVDRHAPVLIDIAEDWGCDDLDDALDCAANILRSRAAELDRLSPDRNDR